MLSKTLFWRGPAAQPFQSRKNQTCQILINAVFCECCIAWRVVLWWRQRHWWKLLNNSRNCLSLTTPLQEKLYFVRNKRPERAAFKQAFLVYVLYLLWRDCSSGSLVVNVPAFFFVDPSLNPRGKDSNENDWVNGPSPYQRTPKL